MRNRVIFVWLLVTLLAFTVAGCNQRIVESNQSLEAVSSIGSETPYKNQGSITAVSKSKPIQLFPGVKQVEARLQTERYELNIAPIFEAIDFWRDKKLIADQLFITENTLYYRLRYYRPSTMNEGTVIVRQERASGDVTLLSDLTPLEGVDLCYTNNFIYCNQGHFANEGYIVQGVIKQYDPTTDTISDFFGQKESRFYTNLVASDSFVAWQETYYNQIAKKLTSRLYIYSLADQKLVVLPQEYLITEEPSYTFDIFGDMLMLVKKPEIEQNALAEILVFDLKSMNLVDTIFSDTNIFTCYFLDESSIIWAEASGEGRICVYNINSKKQITSAPLRTDRYDGQLLVKHENKIVIETETTFYTINPLDYTVTCYSQIVDKNNLFSYRNTDKSDLIYAYRPLF